MTPRIFVFLLLTGWALALGTPARSADGPPVEPGAVTPDQVRAEFETLYQRLQDSHYDLYARRPRAEYDALYRRMRQAIDTPLTREAIEARFRRFVAYGHVAHARIELPAAAWETFRAAGGKAFPLYLRVVDGTGYVIDDSSGLASIAPGDRIVAIDGQPLARWLRRLRAHVSADSDYMAHTMFEPTWPLLMWLERGEVASFQVTRIDAQGERREITVPARSRAEFQAASTASPTTPTLDWNAREARMLPGGIAYLRPGPFYDNRPDAANVWDPTEFRRFLDTAFGEFLGQGASALLIDLRDNPGGDNSFSDPMVAWFATRPFRFSSQFQVKSSVAARASNRSRLDATRASSDSVTARYEVQYAQHAPGTRFDFDIELIPPREGDRFRGRVFLLVNRHSYSNTVLVAALAQDYGFATVLGEETSDLASTYGAMEQFTLPLTGIGVGFPKARILRPSGKDDARGVVPDVAIRTPIVATAEDVVLQRALEVMR